MIGKGVCLIFLITGLMVLSGCVDTKSEVTEIEEPAIATDTPAPVLSTPPETSRVPSHTTTQPTLSQTTMKPTLSQTQDIQSDSPKFSWGDVIEAPNGTRCILLEGNPEISGIYSVYKIEKCPCVRLLSLDVQDTDERFSKVGTQNPMTICNDSALTVLKEPEDVCNIVEPDSLDGHGSASKSILVPYDGRFSITGSHSGEKNFVVKIVDTNGDIVVYLFNAIGTYHNTEVVSLDAGRYTIRIQASGFWTIDITTI